MPQKRWRYSFKVAGGEPLSKIKFSCLLFTRVDQWLCHLTEWLTDFCLKFSLCICSKWLTKKHWLKEGGCWKINIYAKHFSFITLTDQFTYKLKQTYSNVYSIPPSGLYEHVNNGVFLQFWFLQLCCFFNVSSALLKIMINYFNR